jgi:hypothetical protein
MAVLVGIALSAFAPVDHPGRSANVDTAVTFSQAPSGTSAAGSGALVVNGPNAWREIPSQALAGSLARVESLWDTIQVIPTDRAFGLVASEQNFTIEVWNTYRSTQWKIATVAITGQGGLLVDASLPLVLHACGSRIFNATIPEDGPASIANVATFTIVKDTDVLPLFTRTFTATGSRIVLFPFDPDWSKSVKEVVEYATKSVQARNGKEQRYRLRKIPRRRLAFNLALLDGENQAFEAILWNRQAGVFGVPWWQDVVQYNGTLAAGSTTIAIDTTNRLFGLSNMVMVWSSPTACEVQTVESVGTNLITCAALGATYTNPLIAPVFVGRLEPSQDRDYLTSRVATAAVKFACEVGEEDAAPSPPSMTQVYGYDLLQVVPDWKEPSATARRNIAKLDTGIGPISVLDRSGTSFQEIEFPWFLSGRSEIQQLRDFIDRRMGALSPFWVPTWRADLVLDADAPSNASAISVKACGYASRMFAYTARRYLAIRTPAGGWIYRKATSASVVGSSESIGLDSQVGMILPAGTAVSFLVLCRLADDAAEIDWKTAGVATAKTRFLELPREVP